MTKINCAIIGSGNISTDLLYKLGRSALLEPVWMVGIDPNSEGLKRASSIGLKTTAGGVSALIPHLEGDRIRIAFDATSAKSHIDNWELMRGRGIRMIDLTPAAIGKLYVPSINLDEIDVHREQNVNMISCGGQATSPIVHAIGQVHDVVYAEVVASMSSRSVGPGSRANLDEVLETTRKALVEVAGARRAKVLVVVNPADPPILMRNTVSCLIDGPLDERAIRFVIAERVEQVRRYVPGYRIVNGPIFEGRKVTVYLEVKGEGDFLPPYAGNLDIMTAAARRTGEIIAEGLLR